MRIELSPQPVLSGNGYLAAIVQTTKVTLIQTRTGSARDLILPHEGTVVAFDPQTSLMAVSGDRQLSLFQSVDTPHLLSTIPVAPWLDRLAVGEDGLVVGVARFDDRESSHLLAWRGPQLSPLFAETGQSLGPVALDGLLVDGPANRVLYWGLQPNEMGFEAAFYGEGQPFVRLVSLDARASLRQLWGGEGAPAEPNGFLLPLAGGQLGAYSRDRLVVFSPAAESASLWQPVSGYDWNDLETVAASPAGTYLAWLWSSWDGQRDHHHLRVAELAGRLVDEVTFEILGEFPALAVDNHGQATVVFSADKSRIVALTLEQGRLVKRADITVHNWPD